MGVFDEKFPSFPFASLLSAIKRKIKFTSILKYPLLKMVLSFFCELGHSCCSIPMHLFISKHGFLTLVCSWIIGLGVHSIKVGTLNIIFNHYNSKTFLCPAKQVVADIYRNTGQHLSDLVSALT